jgi:hypothetical protein
MNSQYTQYIYIMIEYIHVYIYICCFKPDISIYVYIYMVCDRIIRIATYSVSVYIYIYIYIYEQTYILMYNVSSRCMLYSVQTTYFEYTYSVYCMHQLVNICDTHTMSMIHVL